VPNQAFRVRRYVVIATKTRAPIANPPNSAQLEGTPCHSSSYNQVRVVVWECGEGQTDRHIDTQTAVANIRFASATPHAKCNDSDPVYMIQPVVLVQPVVKPVEQPAASCK